jgi:predicted metal-dependent peptidase
MSTSNEIISENYFGLSITSGNQLRYLGHFENIDLDGNMMPDFISALTGEVPNVHYLIVPRFGLLIIIADNSTYKAYKLKSPMDRDKASNYVASMIAKGTKMKMIEKYGAIEINY